MLPYTVSQCCAALPSIPALGSPPMWVQGAAAGAGAAVAAVAVHAAAGLVPGSWRRAAPHRSTSRRGSGPTGPHSRRARARWVAYLLLGAVAGATTGPTWWWSCSAAGCSRSRPAGPPVRPHARIGRSILPWAATPAVNTGGLRALAWVALKVGLLSYGGGFVIVPLMQADSVDRIHWMRGPY